MDADITGPSIPKMFGITKKAEGSQFGIYPQKSLNDISVMSVNLLLEKELLKRLRKKRKPVLI